MFTNTLRALETTARFGKCKRHSWVEAFDVKAVKDQHRLMCEHCDATITLQVDAYGYPLHIGGSYDGDVMGFVSGPEREPIPAGCGCERHQWEEYLPSREVPCRYELVCTECAARVVLYIDGDAFVEIVMSPSSNPHHHTDPEAKYRANRECGEYAGSI